MRTKERQAEVVSENSRPTASAPLRFPRMNERRAGSDDGGGAQGGARELPTQGRANGNTKS